MKTLGLVGLACLSLLSPARAETAEQTTDEACTSEDDESCMLQAPAESLHRQLQGHRRPSSPQKIPYEDREYHLVPHHKSGWLMSREAYFKMASALKGSKSKALTGMQLEFSARTMGLALNSAMMQTPKESCIAQFARNPFELLVSGYLYHMAESEHWVGTPFGEAAEECEPSFKDRQMLIYCKNSDNHDTWMSEFWMRKAVGGLVEVFHSTHSGPFSSRLPKANAKESFSKYLQRVDLDAGLIAEFVWAHNRSLAPMSFTNDVAASHSCSVNLCFSDFYENCNAAWKRVLTAWEIQEPRYSALLEGATKSCPHNSAYAQKHSSDKQARREKLNHLPDHKMVTRLRELDRLYLNGAIAALEGHLGCPLSGKYKETA